jgi:hypothetical protein
VTIEQLARQSDIVIVARVTAQRSQWRGRVITTDVELTINHSFKGGLLPGSRVTLRLPGGDVGNISQVLHGAPSVQQDETIVAFLRRAPETDVPVYYLAHLSASVLRTALVPNSSTVTVQPAPEGMTVSSVGAATNSTPRTQMSRAGLSLEQLAALVRSQQ